MNKAQNKKYIHVFLLIFVYFPLLSQTLHTDVEDFDWNETFQVGVGAINIKAGDFQVKGYETVIDIYRSSYKVSTSFSLINNDIKRAIDTIILQIPFYYDLTDEEFLNWNIESLDTSGFVSLFNQDTVKTKLVTNKASLNTFSNCIVYNDLIYDSGAKSDSILVVLTYKSYFKSNDVMYGTGIGEYNDRNTKLELKPEAKFITDPIFVKFRNHLPQSIPLFLDSLRIEDSLSYLISAKSKEFKQFNDLSLEVNKYYTSVDLMNNTLDYTKLNYENSDVKNLFDKNTQTFFSLSQDNGIEVSFTDRNKILGYYIILDSSYYMPSCLADFTVPFLFTIEIEDPLTDSVYHIKTKKNVDFRCDQFKRASFAHLLGEVKLYEAINYPEFTITDLFGNDYKKEPSVLVDPYIKSLRIELTDTIYKSVNISELFIITL